jgi:hypothetical protein
LSAALYCYTAILLYGLALPHCRRSTRRSTPAHLHTCTQEKASPPYHLTALPPDRLPRRVLRRVMASQPICRGTTLGPCDPGITITISISITRTNTSTSTSTSTTVSEADWPDCGIPQGGSAASLAELRADSLASLASLGPKTYWRPTSPPAYQPTRATRRREEKKRRRREDEKKRRERRERGSREHGKRGPCTTTAPSLYLHHCTCSSGIVVQVQWCR